MKLNKWLDDDDSIEEVVSLTFDEKRQRLADAQAAAAAWLAANPEPPAVSPQPLFGWLEKNGLEDTPTNRDAWYDANEPARTRALWVTAVGILQGAIERASGFCPECGTNYVWEGHWSTRTCACAEAREGGLWGWDKE
jgi:hypothetical protein